MAGSPYWLPSLSGFIDRVGGAMKERFKEEGPNGVMAYIRENLDQWKTIPINIAVIGETGVGKSTFINTIRNLFDDDEGSALVGVKQTTLTPAPYLHPSNPNLKIWDLPGFGTQEFPKSDYMKKMEATKFDFFLILSATRFREDDVWLADEIRKIGKTFFFVRTKVDRDIEDYNRRRRNKESESKLLGEILDDCRDGLKSRDFAVDKTCIFLIGNHTPSKYDFGRLTTKLIQAAPEKKRESLTLSITTLTKEMLEEKQKVLQEKIWWIAAASGVAGGVPVPGVGVAFDAALLIEEASRYRRQFGLDDQGLLQTAKWLQTPVEDLTSSLDLKSTGISLTVKGIVVLFRQFATAEAVGTATKYGIPVIGSFVAGGVSFWSTRLCLQNLLDMMFEDAMKVQHRIQAVLCTEL